MPEIIENRMVVNSEWKTMEKYTDAGEPLKESGYKDLLTGVFVSEKDAFAYALEQISYDKDLKQELLEWFYSGNWIKEELESEPD